MKKIFLLTILTLFLSESVSAKITFCSSNGNWTSVFTWTNGVPGSGDVAIIPSGKTVTMNTASPQCATLTLGGEITWSSTYTLNLTTLNLNDGSYIHGTGSGYINASTLNVSNGATANIGSLNLAVSGTTTLNGYLLFSYNSGSRQFHDIIIPSGGKWQPTQNVSVTITGSLTNNGTFKSLNGNYTFTGSGETIDGTVEIEYMVVNDGGSITNNGTLTVNEGLNTSSGTGTLINGSNATLYLNIPWNSGSPNYSLSNLTATASGNTVNYSLSDDQRVFTPTSSTYYNLTVSGSNNKYQQNDLTISNDFSISGTSNFTCGTNQITGNSSGNMTMASGTELRLGTANNATVVYFPTNFTTANITLNANSTVRYITDANQTISTEPVYGHLQLEHFDAVCVKSPSTGILYVAGDLSIDERPSGSLELDMSNQKLDLEGTLEGTGNLTFISGNFDIGGDFNLTGSFTPGSGYVMFNGTSDQVVRRTTYFDIGIEKTSGTANVTGGTGSFIVNDNLTVLQGTMDLSSTTVYVDKDLYVYGTLLVSSATGTKTFNLDLVVTNSGTFTNSSNENISIYGNIEVNGGGTFTSGNGIYYLEGSGKQIKGSSSALTIKNIQANGTYTNNHAALTVQDISGSGTFTNGLSKTLYVEDAVTVTTFDASNSGNTVDFSGSGTQNVPSVTYHHLTVTNNNTVTLAGNIVINGNFDNQGNLNTGGKDISLAGEFNNDGIYTASTSTLSLIGTSAQGISGSATPTLYGLTINKSSGNVTLNTPIKVSNDLDLTSGRIMTTTTNLLTLENAATVSNASNLSFVHGPVAKEFNSAASFTFPTGKSGKYRAVSVTPVSASAVTFRTEYFDTTSLNSNFGSPLHHVSTVEYFQVDRTLGSTNANINLSWDANSGVNGDYLSDLRVARWNGSIWEDKGVSSVSGTSVLGNITSDIITSFSPFKIGSTSPNNPLPVELVYFKAQLNESNVELTWETAAEVNNHYFSIERSKDGINFDEIGIIEGYGNSNTLIQYKFTDSNPLIGNSYYRFKQVDFNGQYVYSDIEVINYKEDNNSDKLFEIISFTNQNIELFITGINDNIEVANVALMSIDGKSIALISGIEAPTISLNILENLSSGVYYITLKAGNKKQTQAVFIK